MEVYGYRIILIGPDSKEAEPRYTYYSYINLDGLTVGRWKIKVFGFNKEQMVQFLDEHFNEVTDKNLQDRIVYTANAWKNFQKKRKLKSKED